MKTQLLSDVCTKITDGTHDTPIPLDNGVPYITALHVKDGYIDFDNCYYVDDTTHKIIYKRCNPEKGDVLLVNIGAGTATAALVKVEYEFSMKNVALLKPDRSQVVGEYLELYLLAQKERLFHQLTSGGAQIFFSLKQIGNLRIVLPPFQEQITIANMLSTWDQAIEKTERLIAAKEKRFSWLSNRYLFGDSSLTNDTRKKTRWFSVPANWRIVNIGFVAKEVKSTNGSEKELPVLSCTKYDGLVDSLAYFGKQVFSADTSSYKVVSRGQFAYATNHIEEGSIGYQNIYEKGLVSPMYTVFKTNESIDDSYLYQLLKTKLYTHIFKVSTSASVDRRGSLRWKEFDKLPIPLPPIKEQVKISTLLNTARQEIDLLKKQLDAYKKQKRGLMQKLLTGQWRVKTMGEYICNG